MIFDVIFDAFRYDIWYIDPFVSFHSLVGEGVATALLKALIPMGSELLAGTGDSPGFSELMPVMITLAGAGTGLGHVELFKAANDWLAEW